MSEAIDGIERETRLPKARLWRFVKILEHFPRFFDIFGFIVLLNVYWLG